MLKNEINYSYFRGLLEEGSAEQAVRALNALGADGAPVLEIVVDTPE